MSKRGCCHLHNCKCHIAGLFSQKRWKWCPYTFIKWCNITRQVRTMQLPWKLSLNTLIDLCSKIFVIWHIYFLKLGWNANNVSSFCVSVITLMKVTACSSLIQIMKILTIHEFLSFYVSNNILCSTFKVRNIFYSATISINFTVQAQDVRTKKLNSVTFMILATVYL